MRLRLRLLGASERVPGRGRVMRKTLTVVIAGISALTIAACSSSNSSSTPSSGGNGGGSSTSSADAGVTAAKAYQQQFLNPPTSIGVSTNLKSKPAAGRLLIVLDPDLGSASGHSHCEAQ